jgi:hypothetical protein
VIISTTLLAEQKQLMEAKAREQTVKKQRLITVSAIFRAFINAYTSGKISQVINDEL